MTTVPDRRRAGRPKDTTIDERALEAARELLIREGFAATTIQAVAERAGVHASALYRRWPSRLELVEDAMFLGFSARTIEPTGDLRRDLRAFVTAYLEHLGSPVARVAMPHLLANHRGDDHRRAPAEWLRLSLRPKFQEILAAAPAGTVDAALDPDDVFDLLLGAVLVRVMVPEEARRPPPVDRTVDLLVRMLRPDETS